MTTLGKNIKRIRLHKQMTLKQLADRVGTSKSYIWEIENFEKQPNVFLIGRIAAVLGTSVEKLLYKNGKD